MSESDGRRRENASGFLQLTANSDKMAPVTVNCTLFYGGTMKRILSLILLLSLLLSLAMPAAFAAGVEVGELRLSQESLAPSAEGRLYI